MTKKDVARYADVSSATVTNVLNGYKHVSPEIRERVLKAVKALNYTPNLIARSLQTHSSQHIGLILGDLLNPHITLLAKGAQFEANAKGYILSVALDSSDCNKVIDDFIARQVDGIMIDSGFYKIPPRTLEKLSVHDIPLVTFGPSVVTSGINLYNDYYTGMIAAYEHLIQLGHKRIAFINALKNPNPPPSHRKPSRLEAYITCSTRYHGVFNEDWLVQVSSRQPDFETGMTCAETLFSRKTGCTAIIAVNDLTALGIIRFLNKTGLQVPKDVSIVSFDNTIYASSSCPPLTSVAADTFIQGQKAVQYILQWKTLSPDEKKKPIVEVLPTRLVIRESTAHYE